jgi:hypothetical protein
MKHPIGLRPRIVLLVCTGLSMALGAMAQEAVPLEEAQKIAQKLAATPTASGDQPFTVEVNAEQPVALRGGDAGLIILPDKHLTADSFANAGKAVTPVAQLWTYRVTLANGGKSLENSQVRVVTIGEGDQRKDTQFFLIGVVKNEQGVAELVIFGKGREPVLHVPLTKSSAGSQDFPIALSGRQTGDDSATLTLNLPGQFTADLGVVKAAD